MARTTPLTGPPSAQSQYHTDVIRPVFAAAPGNATVSDAWMRNRQAIYEDFLGRLHKDPPLSPHRTPNFSAAQLIAGIARMHPVALFLATPVAKASETDRLIIDLLQALDLKIKIVDVSADAEMYLGFPQSDAGPILPHLMIGGLPFGRTRAILDGARDGQLAAALTRAKCPFNAAQADALRTATTA